jgi:hypothetical protein
MDHSRRVQSGTRHRTSEIASASIVAMGAATTAMDARRATQSATAELPFTALRELQCNSRASIEDQ